MSHCLVLTSSDNLHRLNISHLFDAGREDGSLEIVQSERNSVPFTPPWWRRSCCMLNCKMADQLSTSWTLDIFHSVWRRTEYSIYVLQNGKFLEKLHLSVDFLRSVVGLLSRSARTLKVLGLTVLYRSSVCSGVCEELEAMAGHNMQEALSFEVKVVGQETGLHWIRIPKGGGDTGQTWVVCLETGFVYKVSCRNWVSRSQFEALRSLPNNYLSHLPIPESVAFNYSAQGRVASICRVWASNSPSQLFWASLLTMLGFRFCNIIDYNLL